MSHLDRPKVDALGEMALDINPELDLVRFPEGVKPDGIDEFLEGVDLYVDSLDFFALDIRRAVFAACAQFDTAVEINCRPERLDPPRELLRMAVEYGCWFTIDTDAHATGQLEWQGLGCDRAADCDVPIDRILNTKPVDELLEWTRAAA